MQVLPQFPPKRRRIRREQNIQAAIFQHLAWRARPDVFAFHPANGGARSRIEAAIMAGIGVVAGTPDIIIVAGGRTYALELKGPGGRLSERQLLAHGQLRRAGATVATAHSLDQAIDQLERWELLR